MHALCILKNGSKEDNKTIVSLVTTGYRNSHLWFASSIRYQRALSTISFVNSMMFRKIFAIVGALIAGGLGIAVLGTTQAAHAFGGSN